MSYKNKYVIILIILILISGCNKNSSETNVSFSEGGGLTDIEGNTYPSVIIENDNGWSQEWMKVNLKTSTYNDGSPIAQAMSDVTWTNNEDGAWCYYNNDPQFEENYGKLYNWHALTGDTIVTMTFNTKNGDENFYNISVDDYNQSVHGAIKDTIYTDSISCKICPDGWRVPYEEDWIDLIMVLGYANVAGGKMKDTSSLWESPNFGATNESGFSGLPGGIRNGDGSFLYLGQMGRWWCFEEVYEDFVHTRPLMYDAETTLNHYVIEKEGGLSVRLIKIK